MLIIIEGADLVGKTTVAKKLLKALPNSYYLKHGVRPKDNSRIEREKIKDVYAKILCEINSLFGPEENLILDRYYPSELVYSKLKRGYSAGEDEFFSQLEKAIDINVNYVLIYVYETEQVLKERFSSRGDDFVDMSDIIKIKVGYEEFLQSTSLTKIIRVQSSSLNIADLIKIIKTFRR